MDNLEIKPVENRNDISEANGFQKLDLTDYQRIGISSFANQLPTLLAAEQLSGCNLYTVKFPEGINGKLIRYKTGGLGSVVVDNKKFVGKADFNEVNTSLASATLAAYSLASMATQQYFLVQINDKLDKISLGINDILGFLYGNKKAELLSEISFTKYAYQNFNSITSHEEQKSATIASLQQSKKVALKNIEFYLNDLDNTISKRDNTKIDKLTENAFALEESLQLSMQLYVMSSILEVYYSNNFDESYISYLENEMSIYITRCEKQMLSDFSVLSAFIESYKTGPLLKFDKMKAFKKTEVIVSSLAGGEESNMKKNIHSALYSFQKEKEYCFGTNGDVYLKLA